MMRALKPWALAFAVLAAWVATNRAIAADRPNLLIILADDLGYSDIGCQGSEIPTPNLDRLAKNGVRLNHFYNTARCWPTRSSLLSGYYAQQIRRDTVPGLQSGGQGKRPGWAPLLPEKLAGAAYRSYLSGKWHVDGNPVGKGQGFARSWVLEDHDRNFSPKNISINGKPARDFALGKQDFFTSTAIADHAIDCLAEHGDKHVGQPFFHLVAFTSPHFPLQAPAADIARHRGKYAAGWDALRQARVARQRELGLPAVNPAAFERDLGPPYPFPKAMEALGANEVNRPVAWDTLNAAQKAFQAAKMEVHAAMVERMDLEIGRIVAQLEKGGMLDNTLVLFLSDNGASAEIMVRGDGHKPEAPAGSAETFLCLGPGWSTACNAPMRRHKTWNHEGGIATPLVAHWPAGIAKESQGKVDPSLGHVVDLLPTALELAGLPVVAGPGAPELPGKSLLAVLKGQAARTDGVLWFKHEKSRALRQGDWKIVATAQAQEVEAPWELYNLATDRGETTNLADAQPERVKAMAQVWQTRWQAYQADAKRE